MITIKLTNKVAYTLITILILLTTSLIVYAANPTTKPNPGHYSQEVMVNVAGTDKTLQAAIDDGSFGGQSYVAYCNGASPCCISGYTNVKDLGKWGYCYACGDYSSGTCDDWMFRPYGVSCNFYTQVPPDQGTFVNTQSIDVGNAFICQKS